MQYGYRDSLLRAMYKITGADGKQYGPVDAEQVRRWISEGRANRQTQAQAEGSEQWKPLGEFPEFAGSFAPPPFAPFPPPGSFPPTGPFHPPREENGMAVAGLVLAILGLVCCGPIFSTLGLIFSCIALSRASHYPQQSGRAMAIAGIVISLIGYALFGWGLAFWRFHRFGRGYRL